MIHRGWLNPKQICLILLAILGLFISFEISDRRMFDPDMAHAILVVEGIKSEGFQWLKDWEFTQDNWLFFLIPFQTILVHLTGEIVHTIAFSGWLVFVCAAVVSGLIAKDLAGYWAGRLVFVLALWIGPYGHLEGYVSYPTSHNITNLFGLLTVWLFLRWWSNPGLLSGITICALQLMAGLSDPWLLAAFTLPMLLSLAVGAVFRKALAPPVWQAYALLTCGLILVFISVKTALFGWVDFMPPMHFQLGGVPTLVNNIEYFVRNIGGLFAVSFPEQVPEITWPETQWLYALPPFMVGGGLFFYSIFTAFKTPDSSQNRIFITLSMFSVCGISAAYILSNVAANLASARFLVNIVYVVLIVLVVFFCKHWSQIRPVYKTLVWLCAALFITSTLVGYQFFINKNTYLGSDREIDALIQTLDTNGLNYGYGPYHGSKSNAVTLLSGGRITIRPVAFDRPGGHLRFGHPQSSRDWYIPEDAPADQEKFFVYLTLVNKECPDFDQCRQALFADFGSPISIIPFMEGTIYVWDQPLINSRSLKVSLGQPLRFDSTLKMPNWSGWSEPEAWGTWSDGKRAFTVFDFGAPLRQDLDVVLSSQAYTPNLGLNQRIRVYVNGEAIAQLEYTPQTNAGEHRFRIPQAAFKNQQTVSLVFETEAPLSPRDRKISNDPRRLGIGISEITFYAAKN